MRVSNDETDESSIFFALPRNEGIGKAGEESLRKLRKNRWERERTFVLQRDFLASDSSFSGFLSLGFRFGKAG